MTGVKAASALGLKCEEFKIYINITTIDRLVLILRMSIEPINGQKILFSF